MSFESAFFQSFLALQEGEHVVVGIDRFGVQDGFEQLSSRGVRIRVAVVVRLRSGCGKSRYDTCSTTGEGISTFFDNFF